MQAKTELFEKPIVHLAQIAKALSHPARIKILHILQETQGCMCKDIVELLPLSQSTVSQHLKELKEVKLIIGEIEGPKVCYCINQQKIQEISAAFDQLFARFCCKF